MFMRARKGLKTINCTVGGNEVFVDCPTESTTSSSTGKRQASSSLNPDPKRSRADDLEELEEKNRLVLLLIKSINEKIKNHPPFDGSLGDWRSWLSGLDTSRLEVNFNNLLRKISNPLEGCEQRLNLCRSC